MADVSTIEEDVRAVLGISLPTPPNSGANTPNTPQIQTESPTVVPHPINLLNGTETTTTATQTGPERHIESEGRGVRISSLIDPPNTTHSAPRFEFPKLLLDMTGSN